MQKRSRLAFEADLQQKESPYVFFGTPLPPLDEKTRDDGSFVPIWKQEVVDERGRKRLHGAFTGGWSAGYFNTVGSKEGWTPSTFVSSRQNRSVGAAQNGLKSVEDYMDEDDVREAEETRDLQVASGFEGFGTEHDAVRNAALIDLFHTTQDGVGKQLLQRMGWREGQGIGPLVKRAARLDDNDQIQSLGEAHLFAPEDVPMIHLVHKTDYKGAGYASELLEPAHPSHSSSIATASRSQARQTSADHQNEGDDQDEPESAFRSIKSSISGKPTKVLSKSKSGFGVGVLNESGSEDDDPYAMGPKIGYNKTLGAQSKKKPKHIVGGVTKNPKLKNNPHYVGKSLPSLKNILRKCHDNRLPLDGFVFGNELDSLAPLSLNDGSYKPPDVPGGWTFTRAPVSGDSIKATYVSTKDAARMSNLDAKARATLLQEKALPGKSVFDYLSPAARERLVQVSGRQDLPSAKGELPAVDDLPSGQPRPRDATPYLEKDIAVTALRRRASGWMPYAEDTEKRDRYFAFLEIQATPDDNSSARIDTLKPGKMRSEDWSIELQEFVRAAQVFQPISGLMANRFTTSTSLPDASTNSNEADGEAALMTRPATKLEDPAVAAAKAGMFGAMTRSVAFFSPTRLLCKRFGVPMPDASAVSYQSAEARGASVSTKSDYLSEASKFRSTSGIIKTETSQPAARTAASGDTTASPARTDSHRMTDDVPVDPESNSALEQERPGMAVFRSIFGGDGEDL